MGNSKWDIGLFDCHKNILWAIVTLFFPWLTAYRITAWTKRRGLGIIFFVMCVLFVALGFWLGYLGWYRVAKAYQFEGDFDYKVEHDITEPDGFLSKGRVVFSQVINNKGTSQPLPKQFFIDRI